MLQENLTAFHSIFTDAGHNPRYGLVTFSAAATLDHDMADVSTFAFSDAFLDIEFGGSQENGSLAVSTAATASFRPDAAVNFIILTDEDDDGTSSQRTAAVSDAISQDALLWLLLGEGHTTSAESDYQSLIADTGGFDGSLNPLSFEFDGGDGWANLFSHLADHPHNNRQGDYNNDGMVDAADYALWRDNLGSTTNLAADGDNSGTIDSGDFTVWKNNYGATAAGSSPATAPEPATWLLLAGILLAMQLPPGRGGR